MPPDADDHLAQIREAVKHAAEELATLKARCRVLVKFIAAGYEFLGGPPDVQPKRHGPPSTGIHLHIEAMMRAAGRPLSLREITAALARADRIHGRHMRETVRTAICRQKKFERVGRGIYWLKIETPTASVTGDEP
jgi:hypothetical protein